MGVKVGSGSSSSESKEGGSSIMEEEFDSQIQ